MKKLAIVSAVSGALLLAGCGGGGDEAPTTVIETQVNAARVQFDPSNGVVPVPSNILLSGTTDGTLNIPVADPTDESDPQVALNGLDGWGTHSTMVFNFSLPLDASGNPVGIDASTLEAPGSIRMFEAVMGGTAVSPECAAASPAATCAVVAELTHGVDFTVAAVSSSSVAVIPLRPLKAKTGYKVVLTSNIEDDLGRAVKASQTYGLMQRDADVYPVSGDASAVGLQRLINSHEDALAAFGVSKDSIIYVSSYTTQSISDVFTPIKGLMLQQFMASGQPSLALQDTTISVADALVSAGALQADPQNPAYLAASTASLYQGSVSLPYFSPLPTESNPTAPLTGNWKAACDSPASILGGVQAGLIDPVAAGIPAEALTNPALLLPPNNCFDFPGVDDERHLTKYNPVPAVQGMVDVPAVVSVPDEAAVNQIRALQGLDPITMPAGGWPVVIFQHGITGNKTNAFGIAGTLSLAGFATVAIDHPLHGDRGFGAINASTGSPTAYMNLASLLTARDNLRQSVSDLLGLRLSLNNTQGAPLDGSNVFYVGHSLGAIAGTVFTAVANDPQDMVTTNGMALPNFSVRATSLMAPGGSIANFLLASPSFGPVVKSQLLFSAEPEFASAALAAAEAQGIAPTSPQFQNVLIAVYDQFWAGLSAAEQAEINGVFEQFAFAAQSVVDSGDPINYVAEVAADESPIHLIEVVGSDTVLPDQVIPNAVAGKPLAGTEPMIALLGLDAITQTVISQDGMPVSGVARFTEGDHGSIVDPSASAAATMEMQMQAAGWFSTGATVIPVNNPSVLLGGVTPD